MQQIFLRRPRLAFFILTFAIAWSIWLPVGYLAPKSLLLAIIPGAWAPSLAAILLTAVSEGWAGVKRYLGRLFKWRVGFGWYAVVLFGTAAIAYAAIGLGVLLGGHVPALSLPAGVRRDAWPLVIPIAFLVNIFMGGPLAEDLGWRGYILPKLRERMDALTASLIIGVVWALWHAPLFLFPEGASVVGHIPFLWFALLTTAWSVLMGWAYVNTRSILMPVLFHAAMNTTLGTLGVLGQANGSLTPLILNTALTWAAVAVVVAVYGRDLQRAHLAGRGWFQTGVTQLPSGQLPQNGRRMISRWRTAKSGAISPRTGVEATPEVSSEVFARAQAAAFGDVVDWPTRLLQQRLGLRQPLFKQPFARRKAGRSLEAADQGALAHPGLSRKPLQR
jgi:membrane protease YdiL (CAAX protease family)